MSTMIINPNPDNNDTIDQLLDKVTKWIDNNPMTMTMIAASCCIYVLLYLLLTN